MVCVILCAFKRLCNEETLFINYQRLIKVFLSC